MVLSRFDEFNGDILPRLARNELACLEMTVAELG
jgi:hypothetical protein